MNSKQPNSDPPHYRTDVLTGRRVIIAPGRSMRPAGFPSNDAFAAGTDPFAEGSEYETPPEVLAVRKSGGLPDRPGWSIRVVPNRYPAVVDANDAKTDNWAIGGNSVDDDKPLSLFPASVAGGQHEVVIECPDPRTNLLQMSATEIAAIFKVWRDRLSTLVSGKRFQSLVVFRNEGSSAGASLAHCHSQIIATKELTESDRRRLKIARDYYQRVGKVLQEDLLDAEIKERVRIVRQCDRLVALCPFAPQTAYHVRLLPYLNRRQTFDDISADDLQLIASRVRCLVEALSSEIHRGFSFNCVLINPPCLQPPIVPLPGWMLEILPRLNRRGGWEFASDMDIVTVSPEQTAEILRRRFEDTTDE
jgi:UDPglucose--hexose-1-phosphate uridylyltransferase